MTYQQSLPIAVIIAFCASLSITPVQSAEVPSPKRSATPAKDFLARFQGVCLGTAAQLEQIEAFSRVEKWSPAPQDLATLGAPPDAKNYRAWVVRTDNSAFLVGYNEGIREPFGPVRVCSMAGNGVGGRAIRELLRGEFGLKVVDEFSEGFQVQEAYQGEFASRNQLIMNNYIPDDPKGYVSLSTVVPVRRPGEK